MKSVFLDPSVVRQVNATQIVLIPKAPTIRDFPSVFATSSIRQNHY